MTAKVEITDWILFERSVRNKEFPSRIALMLFNILHETGYTKDDIQAMADILLTYAEEEKL